MLRSLRDDVPHIVVSLAPRAPADLVEVPCGQDRRLLTVVLAQPREEHRADGHVDADSERVRAADNLEQTLLRELFDQDAVLRQQSGVVQTNAVAQPAFEFRPVRTQEAKTFQRAGDRRFFVLGANVDARERLCALGRGGLCEVHDVQRPLAARHQTFQGLRERRLGVGVFQWDGALGGAHCDRLALVQRG